MARAEGFENINVDLMSAIPGQSLTDWEENLKTVAELAPEHISAYSLIVEEGTPFYEEYGEGRHADELPDEETERKMYWRTKEILSKYGYERYEISIMQSLDMLADIISDTGSEQNIWGLEPELHH